MTVAKRLRTDDVAGGGTPQPLVGGASKAVNPLLNGNMGTGDVRNSPVRTWRIYGHNFAAGTDSFKLGVYAYAADGQYERTDTVAFVHGTNLTAVAIQAALRTATGDGGLTVTGTTNFDASGFTVTSTEPWEGDIVAHTLAGGADVQIDRGSIAYGDAGHGLTGTPGTTPSTGGIAFDQESSRGVGETVPLGYSIVSDGTGVTADSTLLPPTCDSVVGNNGDGTLVISATEVASGGTGAEVLYAVRKLEQAHDNWVLVDAQDADGDYTTADLGFDGDVVVLGHTVTANGRVSRPWAPVYATIT